jgi:hypothetical protein
VALLTVARVDRRMAGARLLISPSDVLQSGVLHSGVLQSKVGGVF